MINYFVLLLEYFLTRGKGILSNVIICVIISFVFYKMGSEKSIAIETSKTAVDLLGILLGFTISLFAIILSVDNEIINKAKLKSLDVKFYKEKFTVYDRLITNIAFVIFLFSLLLIYNFLFPVIFESILKTYLIFYVLDVAIIIFSILELLACILNYYLLITSKNQNQNK